MSELTDEERAGATVATFIPAGGFDQDGAASEDEQDWRSFLDEMADAIQYAKITVYRVPTHADGRPAKRQMAYLFECGLDEYSYSQLCTRIQGEFGSGVYRIQVRDRGGVLRRNKSVAIEAPKARERPAGGSPAGDVIDRMSRAMSEQQERFEQVLHRMTGREVDPVEQMTKIAGAMAAMMQAMGLNQNQQPPQTALERLREMELTWKIMRRMSDGGDARSDGFWGAIAETAKHFGPPLMAAVAQAQKAGQLNADGSLRRTLPAPAGNPRRKEPEKMNVDEVRPQLQFLLTQAQAKVEPAEVVKFILGALPDGGDAQESLEAFLLQDDCLQQCIAVLPEIEAERPWFEAWRAAMLSALEDYFDESDELTLAPAPGDDAAREAGEASENPPHAPGAAPARPVHADGDSQRQPGDARDP